MAKAIALEDFQRVFGSLTELSSVALGASIVSCSDEFFAPASDLLKVAVCLCLLPYSYIKLKHAKTARFEHEGSIWAKRSSV